MYKKVGREYIFLNFYYYLKLKKKKKSINFFLK